MTDDRRQGELLSLPPLVTESVQLDIAARMLAAMVRANADDIARWAASNTQGEPTAITYADRKRVALSLLLADELIARCRPADEELPIIPPTYSPYTSAPASPPTPSIFSLELTPDQARALEWVRAGEGGRQDRKTMPSDLFFALGELIRLGLVDLVVRTQTPPAESDYCYELTALGRLVKQA